MAGLDTPVIAARISHTSVELSLEYYMTCSVTRFSFRDQMNPLTLQFANDVDNHSNIIS